MTVPLNLESINAAAARELDSFRARVVGVPYERKGILYSEMFFLYLCAQRVAPRRVLESGRARGQSTLLLSKLFPDLPIISVEHDRSSPDVPVANERLASCANVDLRFGDATRILPAEVRKGDIVLIDGPKGFRGLRLALRLLATGRPELIFVHDCGVGGAERCFLDANVAGTLFSDAIEFARIAHVLDAACWAGMPTDRRFVGNHAPLAYGYGLACLPRNDKAPYWWLLMRAGIEGFLHRHLAPAGASP